ncbi:WD40 repeat domain-containing protein [Lentzea chajnantorensis]
MTRTGTSAQLLDGEGVLTIKQVRDGRVLAVVRGTGAAPVTTTAVAAPTTTTTSAGQAVGSGDSAGRWEHGPGDPNGTRLWDVTDPAHPRRLGDPLVPHSTLSSVTAQFAPSADIMVTGGVSGGVFLWDLGNRILPQQLGPALTDNGGAVHHLEFSTSGDLLATAGHNGAFVLWDLAPTFELRGRVDETACAVTGGGLDRELWSRYVPDLEFQETC